MRPDGLSGFPPDVAIHTARQQLTITIYFDQRPPAPKAITVRLGHADSTAIDLRGSKEEGLTVLRTGDGCSMLPPRGAISAAAGKGAPDAKDIPQRIPPSHR